MIHTFVARYGFCQVNNDTPRGGNRAMLKSTGVGTLVAKPDCIRWNAVESLHIRRSETAAQGPSDLGHQRVPIVLAGNASTGFNLCGRVMERIKQVVESCRPLFARSGQPNGMRKFLQGADWRANHGTTAGKVFMQLQGVDELRVFVHRIAQHAYVHMLDICWEGLHRFST